MNLVTDGMALLLISRITGRVSRNASLSIRPFRSQWLEETKSIAATVPRIAASLFQNPSDAFRHTCQWVRVNR
jgi:hypothetical protein